MENQGLAQFDRSFLYELWNRIEFDWTLPSSKIHNRELSYISDQQFTELQLNEHPDNLCHTETQNHILSC